MKFHISVSTLWKPFMLLIGITGPAKRYVELTEEGLDLRFGWWKDHIPWERIADVQPRGWKTLYGYGMRIAPESTLGLVGTSSGVVSVALGEAQTFKVPMKMSFENVALSLDDPEGFMTALRHRLEQDSLTP